MGPLRVDPRKLTGASILNNSYSGPASGVIPLEGVAIQADATWPKCDLPYLVQGEVAVVGSVGVKLTIEPGVTVRFAPGASIRMGGGGSSERGALIAKGTEAAPILFTSGGSSPAPGDWAGLRFYNGPVGVQNEVQYATIEYGGNGSYGGIYKWGASGGDLALHRVTVRKSNASGVRLDGGLLTATSTTFDQNAQAGLWVGTAANANVGGSTFSSNGTYGCDVASPVQVAASSFTANGMGPLRVDPRYLTGASIVNNSYSGAGSSSIPFSAFVIQANATWPRCDLPYLIEGEIAVVSSAGATLTLQPGVTVRFGPGASLRMGGFGSAERGVLVARGTPTAPITFTSDVSSPAPGDWRGLYLYQPSGGVYNVLEYCIIRFSDYGVYAPFGNLPGDVGTSSSVLCVGFSERMHVL
ncbi:MAG: right-handed parallel beta-helix repeat-containing protein [Deltaproteobacteria bacterium]|nr:right-handed parallel beta-helix repeat-containing protein [Deltaproteobacteria bacterium]